MTTTRTICLSATTYPEIEEVCYRWTICNVSLLLKDQRSVLTPFRSSKTKCTWQCSITQEDGCLKFGLDLSCKNHKVTLRTPAEFKFSLIVPEGELILVGPYNHNFFSTITPYRNLFDSILTKNELLRYKTDPGDTITIVCRVRAMLHPEISADNLFIPASKMQHECETILLDKKFTDVTLVVEGRSIKAHKAILAARSPVFAAMFSTDMEENRQNKVTITDMEYEVVQKLLQFIYTGKTDITSMAADQLLVAADKYSLIRLKAQCEQTILSTLTFPTAIKTLIFADRLNAQQLKSHTMKFIKTYIDKVMKSADWKTMAIEHPTLLVEVCPTLARAL